MERKPHKQLFSKWIERLLTRPLDQENHLTEEDNILEKYGITREISSTFHFAGYKYQRLEDAVRYAKDNQQLLSEKAEELKRQP